MKLEQSPHLRYSYRRVAITTACLAIFSLMGAQCHAAPACFAKTRNFPSPTMSSVARLTETVCGDVSYAISIRRAGIPIGAAVEVFQSSSEPLVVWEAGRLQVTITQLAVPTKSLHAYNGVEVVYRVANRLTEENFKRTEEKYFRSMNQQIHDGKATFVGNEQDDEVMLETSVAGHWAAFRAFEVWSNVNAQFLPP